VENLMYLLRMRGLRDAQAQIQAEEWALQVGLA
jgi:hypothetical protein